MPLSRSAGMLLLPVGCFCGASGLLLMKAAGDSSPDLPPWLQKRLERADLACIALVLLGVTLVSTFGPHEESAPSLPALLAAYTRPRFALFAAAALITAALVLSKSVCGVSDKSSVLPLISAFAAAATGCISQLMLKVVSTTASAFPATAVPLALALLGLCVSAPLHLTLLNRTLVGAAVALAVPAYQFLLIVCTTSAGGVLLDEFESLSSGDLWAYACGVVTATVGLVGLSYFSSVGAEPGGDEEGSSDESDKAALELERGAEGGSGHSGSTSSDAAESATSLPPRPMLSQLRGDRTQGSILRGRLSRKSRRRTLAHTAEDLRLYWEMGKRERVPAHAIFVQGSRLWGWKFYHFSNGRSRDVRSRSGQVTYFSATTVVGAAPPRSLGSFCGLYTAIKMEIRRGVS
ncbi:hypothetical protein EMIHUDRAFT_114026 [Emiliania huxleyi CCMP1516]|uniref:EamA domain-containing protein n=2 Tax=Emiliania huxleyi TaxID=2903 RepID=A0A0D3JZA6_EMIH1|nr:hypothetical protein EMIHUDRAFT_114026 [Emiliania huxleyi CCMP1516]EOD28841.1 hypothetical protein EMIHUDRAFT_114026 [Emiliania huxleyi CCMP1516]|eukprot:XP_005781270.1 hypothetical protein EMIHUDRAFT_114026 [Emiliania huxleyi CCMP1516]